MRRRSRPRFRCDLPPFITRCISSLTWDCCAVDGSKTYFDTNVSQHHHFFIEGENDLLDIPDADVVVGRTPIPPEGYEIARVDVVVRLRRKPR